MCVCVSNKKTMQTNSYWIKTKIVSTQSYLIEKLVNIEFTDQL